MGLLVDVGKQKGLPLPKICYKYPPIMKLDTFVPYIKKIQKHIYINHLTHSISSWRQLTSAFFRKKFSIFVISGNIDKNFISIHNLYIFDFFWVLKGCFDQHDCNLDDASKISYSRPPWRKVFLTDRKFKSCLGYPCKNYLPIADRPEKTKHKQEITDFFQNDFILNILILFFFTFLSTPSNVLFG